MKLNNLWSSCFHRGETKCSKGNGAPALPPLSEESSPRNERSLANQGSRQPFEDEEPPFEGSSPPVQLLHEVCSKAFDKNPSPSGETSLPAEYLELIVSDVLNWQAQIKAILSYVSTSEKVNLEDSSHLWKLRVSSLIKENQQLIGTFDKTSRDKLETEDSILELQQELDRLRGENHIKDRQLKDLSIKHHEEVQELKNQLLQFEKRDQLLKNILNHSPCDSNFEEWWLLHPCRHATLSKDPSQLNSTSPNTPDINTSSRKIHAGIDTGDESTSRRDCASPESLHIQSEIQKLQAAIRCLEARIDSKFRNNSRLMSRSGLGRSSDIVGDQLLLERANWRRNVGSKIPKPANNRPASACSLGEFARSISSTRMRRFSARTPTLRGNPMAATLERDQSEKEKSRRHSEKTLMGTKPDTPSYTRPGPREKPTWRP